MGNDESPPPVWQQTAATATTRQREAASWRGGNLSAGGGRGLVAVKEATRVVAHIDMDAFYAQIEQVKDPVCALLSVPSCCFLCSALYCYTWVCMISIYSSAWVAVPSMPSVALQ